MVYRSADQLVNELNTDLLGDEEMFGEDDSDTGLKKRLLIKIYQANKVLTVEEVRTSNSLSFCY